MAYNPSLLSNFRLNVVVRTLLLTTFVLGFSWSWQIESLIITPLVFIVFILVSLVNLIFYIERSNRDLGNFLNNIYYQEFSLGVPNQNKGASFERVTEAYNLITQSFRRLVHQKNEYHELLESVVNHMDVAVICLTDEGNIRLMNSMSKSLLQTPSLHHIDSLRRIDPFIAECIGKLVNGEKRLISAHIKGKAVQLAIHSSHFTIADQSYQLISMQNIRDELEQKEVEAWQQLTQVLSHEIINSATPILSLSSSIKENLSAGKDDMTNIRDWDEDEWRDLSRSIDSIESRSRSLVDFVGAYKGLTQIPRAKIILTDMNNVIANIQQLLAPELTRKNVKLELRLHQSELFLRIDPQLIEQALINLIRNAVDAVNQNGTGKIIVSTEVGREKKVNVCVTDNGVGIPDENLSHVFMPFFTTKEKGTGVGLSVSRQIMFMNRGLLMVDSTENMGTRFTMEFNE